MGIFFCNNMTETNRTLIESLLSLAEGDTDIDSSCGLWDKIKQVASNRAVYSVQQIVREAQELSQAEYESIANIEHALAARNYTVCLDSAYQNLLNLIPAASGIGRRVS